MADGSVMPIVRIALFSLSGSAILIGASVFAMGADFTGNFFAQLLFRSTGSGGPITGLSPPNVDSELRFYSVLWITYGITALQTARNLQSRMRLARILLAIFFAGGMARLLSALTVGWPDPLFIVLMWIELVLPALTLLLAAAVNSKSTEPSR
jgi:hypothetical protein